MKNFNQHILHQVNLEVITNSEQQAFRLKNEIDSFLKVEFLPRIELLFDNLNSGSQIMRYDSIDLEISINPNESLHSVSNLLIDQLNTRLRFSVPQYSIQLPVPGIADLSEKWNGNAAGRVNSPEKPSVPEPISDEEESLLYFLETGQLPWFVDPLVFSATIQSKSVSITIQNKVFLQKLRLLFTKNFRALERFVQQMNSEITLELISHLAVQPFPDQKKFKSKMAQLPALIENQVYKLIIGSLIGHESQHLDNLYTEIKGKLPGPVLKSILEMLGLADRFESREPISDLVQKPINNHQPLHSEPNYEKDLTKHNDFKAIYIQNAGLILAHPFFAQLFTQTGCAGENKVLLPDKMQKAVQLLHYLASGEETSLEFNMTFEKYLCGLPLEMPLVRAPELIETDKSECDDVLRAMVKHWPQLKNTSPDGLRQLFFHRNGKLDLHQTPHKLFVERRAQDVLLENLPWNISIVKLPWMNDLLFVEW